MGEITDTEGWHTVAAITYSDVNAAIAANGTKPASFQVTATDESVSSSGQFGDWVLTLGGSGPNISMRIGITGGSITGPFGQHGAETTLPVAACAFPILVRAQYIPHTGDPNVHDLKLDNSGQGGDSAPVTVGAYLDNKQPTSSFLANAGLQELLQQWLTDNINQFNALFASVDLDADYTLEGLSWLKPTYKGYAVAERVADPTLDNSTFAVMCLIDGDKPPADLAYAVSPFAIPDGARAGFLISANKFLQHMMLAAVPAMFKDIQNDDPTKHFVIDNDGTRIRNTGGLKLLKVKLENGHEVEPAISASQFAISVQEQELVIAMTDMVFEYSPGITVHLNYQGSSSLYYDKTKGLLDLAIKVQSGNGSVEVSKAIQITDIVLGVVAIVASLAAAAGGAVSKVATAAVQSATNAAITTAENVGESTEAVQQATVTALRGLISGSVEDVSAIASRASAVAKVAAAGAFAATLMPAITEIMKSVAEGDYQSMPKITELTDAAVGKTVIWPKEVGTFTLDSARLDGCLQFGLVKSAS